MLKRLHIRNYAIIDEIVIEFSSNLNIITGETGAGKSILVGALNLVLGGRFDSSALYDKEKKCFVEAFFQVKENNAVSDFLQANELDNFEELTIRRELSLTGKSRAFINDTPVNLVQLKSLGSLLVDLHQQFDTLELGSNDFQRQVIDALAENNDLLKQYRNVFFQYCKTRDELAALKQLQQNASAVQDYNSFLFNELEDANLRENELEELETELKLLNNAEDIKLQLSAVTYVLSSNEEPVIQQLKLLVNKLNSLKEFIPELPDLSKRLESAMLEVKDITDELESINESVQYSPERLQVVNDKISMGYKLLKKHNVHTTHDLLEIKEALREKLSEMVNISDEISKKETLAGQLFNQCEKLAGDISVNRNKVIKPFVNDIHKLLTQVGMPNAQIRVDVRKIPLDNSGSDAIVFLFDANKSNRFEELYKVASGGELSRLMLCIKSLVVQKLELPVLIFDEIDSGISGEAAKQVGLIMKTLSRSHQLISITHQPQIAAKADAHYFVFKAVNGDRITTSIRSLNKDERITAIAKMLGGEKPTDAAIENAREMVSN